MSDGEEQANRLESLLLNIIFAVVALGLLASIGMATRTGSAKAGWWTLPALMPAIALGLLVVANAITLLRAGLELRADPPTAAEKSEAWARIIDWVKPLEFLGYFGAYLWAVGWIGYAPASLIFVQWLLFRTGLRTAKWRLAGVGFAVALVLVFRIGLGVWMPAPPLYDLLPDALRSYAIRWF